MQNYHEISLILSKTRKQEQVDCKYGGHKVIFNHNGVTLDLESLGF